MEAAQTQNNLGRYGGASGEQRRANRLEQLLNAGLEIFGTSGYASSSVKAICQQAELTERYFYESFGEREDLLFAVYERVADAALMAGMTASSDLSVDLETRLRAGLRGFFAAITDDVRKARVLSLEVVGVSERLERRRRATMHAFAAYLEVETLKAYASYGPPSLDIKLTTMSLVGATNELLIEWLLGDTDATIDALVEHCTTLYLAVARSAFGVDA
ncbi:MAG: TetR/AcrR family transcriptional regulator [Thermoleophilaceae bacterium]|nr:TetR/AcrR family transcriptional regulator [Thermoleophilaceae bacterium]